MPNFMRGALDATVDAEIATRETRVATPFGTVVAAPGNWIIQDYLGRAEVMSYDDFVAKFDASPSDPNSAAYLTKWKPAPRLDSIEPTSGAPGTTVYLHGNYFNAAQGTNKVYIGLVNKREMTVVSWSAKDLVVTVPAGVPTGYPVEIWVVVANREGNHLAFQATA